MKPEARLNPCELEIDLFCKGLRLDSSCKESIEIVRRNRAGLGSGIELILPGSFKDVWVNVPVSESFAAKSPYLLKSPGGNLALVDERSSVEYPVRLNPLPGWYQKRTSRGVPMNQVGVLQGTYLGIYIGPVCRYWREPKENCRFCTTGLNVAESEVASKSVQDVVETCVTARRESGITFVHFNSGYQEGRDLSIARPFLQAVKERTGLLVGIQLAPVSDFSQYDEFIELGADHFSFCFEFMSESVFTDLCPGKSRTLGQEAFFRAMEYTSSKLGKGRVSGEIIAGVEPIASTLEAIDRITDCGAFPTICVFRPVAGSDMEKYPPPRFEEMRHVYRYMIERCIARRIPIGIAPNVEVSLVPQPTDALYLARRSPNYFAYRAYNGLLGAIARPVLSYRLRRRDARFAG